MGSELDTQPLAVVLRAMGVEIALPVAVAPDRPLAFRLYDDGALAPDAAGVPAPAPGAVEVRPVIVFVPLLAFDRRGGRLGQGGGYYDRTLAALRAAGPRVRAVGLAYAGQAVAQVPAGPSDQRLDGVLTEQAYLEVEPRR